MESNPLAADRDLGGMNAFGLYIHVPFCPQICPYCAFASVAGREQSHLPYVEAICREIESWRHLRGPLDTVFLGGGTPTQIESELIARILAAVRLCWEVRPEAEISVEVNPGTVDREKFSALKSLGCNRLSIGAQAFSDTDLRLLGRVHSADDITRAYVVAREVGFANISLDLIADMPGVTADNWRYSVDRAIDLAPEHLSVYSLIVEEGTLFAERRRHGRLVPVADDQQAATMEWTVQRLVAAGYEHYEVSNYARTGYHSRHNWGYWTGAAYLGVGLGAHSFIADERSWNTRDLDTYLVALENGESPREGCEFIDPDTARRERLWLGLRTATGIQLSESEVAQVQNSKRFADIVALGYAGLEGQRLYLTDPGLVLADALGLELEKILEGRAYVVA